MTIIRRILTILTILTMSNFVIAQNLDYKAQFDSLLLEKELEAAIKTAREGQLSEAYIFYAQGISQVLQSKFKAALPLLQAADSMQVAALGTTEVERLRILVTLSGVLAYLGDRAKAEENFIFCKKALEETGEKAHPTYADCLHSMGLLYFRNLRFEEALVLLEASVDLKKQLYPAHHASLLDTQNNLAQLYKFLGRLQEAESRSLELAKIIETQPVKMLPVAKANIYLILGMIQHELGILDKSIATLEKARDMVPQESRISPAFGTIMRELALANYDNYRDAQADTCFEMALDVNEALFGLSSEQCMMIMGWWAGSFCRRDDAAKAGALLQKMEANFVGSKDFKPERSSIYLQTKAHWARLVKDYATAIQFYDKSIAISKETNNLGDGLTGLLSQKFSTYFEWGKPDSASVILKTLNNWVQDQYLLKMQSLTDEERLNSTKTQAMYFHFNANLQYRFPTVPTDDLLNFQLFQKNILEFSMRKTQAMVRQASDPASKANYNNWVKLREQWSEVATWSMEEAQKEGIDKAKLENDILLAEKKLVWAGITMPETERLKWQQIQAQLRPGEGALDISKVRKCDNSGTYFDTTFYMCSIYKYGTAKPRVFFLENANEIDAFYAAQFQSEIKSRKEVSRTVYDKIWAVIDKNLTGIETLYLVADGIFHKINLSALCRPDGSYLLDQLDIRTLTHLRELLHRDEKTTESTPALAVLVGNPAFNNTQKESTEANSEQNSNNSTLRELGDDIIAGDFQLAPLPGSEKEVNAIAAKLKKRNWQTQVLIQAAASEENIKSLKSPAVLHLATHGYFLKNEKAKSADLPMSAASESNPAFRSMLFFAGAENSINGQNAGAEDGILTAYEATVLPLDGTELVVLSACNTGLGKIQNGEGVIGLQRAFRIAGAKSLIMSLWEVEDTATQLFMNSFYENWLSGMSKTEAFRKAQLTLKAKYPQPFYWGSFILVNG